MNKQISRLGAVMILLYLALFVQLNVVQVLKASDLNDNPNNTRAILRDFGAPRGVIATADGVIVAESIEVDRPDSEFTRQRSYPEGELYAHTTGYFSLNFGAEGVERTYTDELSGNTLEQEIRSLSDLFVDRSRVGNVTLTIRHDLQTVAREALGQQIGSVVAIDPATGGVLALWSFPSYDPNPLASIDGSESRAAALRLGLASPKDDAEAANVLQPSPAIPRAYRETLFPGSTFKIVTGSVGLESGEVTPTDPAYPVETEYTPPLTNRAIRNSGRSCGGSLIAIVRDSCNTAFARMGVDLGADTLVAGAEDFGFNDRPPLDLPAVARSPFPDDDPGNASFFDEQTPLLAFGAFGQSVVKATALQMALVASGIVNDGRIMEPKVVKEVRDTEGALVHELNPKEWKRPLSETNARVMREAMKEVVARGTASSTMRSVNGIEVGAKTGTAEVSGDSGDGSHVWVIAWAGNPGDPRIAVAVVVEAKQGVSQFGGREAGPIAQRVIEAALAAAAPPAQP